MSREIHPILQEIAKKESQPGYRDLVTLALQRKKTPQQTTLRDKEYAERYAQHWERRQ
jgi:hypothetical protein